MLVILLQVSAMIPVHVRLVKSLFCDQYVHKWLINRLHVGISCC